MYPFAQVWVHDLRNLIFTNRLSLNAKLIKKDSKIAQADHLAFEY